MKQIFLILALASLAISCSKDNKATSNTELLTASPWFNTRSIAQVGGVTTEAPYHNYPKCIKDDPFIFTADGKLETNQGVLGCPGELPYTYHYQWQFKDNQTTLALNINGWSDWEIIKLTKDTLVLRVGDAAAVNTDYYSHQ